MLFRSGYSTTDKLLLQVALNEPNFLGTGNTFGVEVNTGQTQRTASVSYVDPYFTNDGVSLGADLYSRTFNASNSGLGDYRIRSSGAGLRLGIPYTELDRLSFGLVFEQNQIKPGTTGLPQRYIDYVNQFGTTSDAWLLTFGWSRDSRDSGYMPTRGRLQRFNFDVTFSGQDLSYYRATYQHAWYIPVTKDYTWLLSADLGYGRGFGGKPYPVFKNFYAGGIGSVRGFGSNSLGPRDVKDNSALGGNASFVASTELLFSKLQQGWAGVLGVLGSLSLARKGVNVFADFDDTMLRVQALSGATGEQFDALTAKAQELGAKTRYSASEAAQGMSQLAAAGQSTEQIMESIGPALNLAAAGGSDLGTTTSVDRKSVV